MNDAHERLAELNLVGGRLCLDFANTVGARGAENRNDRLVAYPELVWWSVRAGVVGTEAAEELLQAAHADPDGSAHVFGRAIALREAIYRIFSAMVAGGTADPEDLRALNSELARAMARARVIHTADGFGWGWDSDGELDWILWPVVRSAAELLTSGQIGRVGECAGEHCGWLFLDESKNRSRRWCDMRDCGNRAKVRRHYRRARQSRSTAGG